MSTLISRLNQRILKGGTNNNRLISLLLALLVAVLSISLMLISPNFLTKLEGSLLDARFRLRGPIEPSGLVTLVAIDDRSIETIGRWPWSREILADLIDKTNALGADTIGLDIIFSEPQPSATEALLQSDVWSESERSKITSIGQQLNPDQTLITTLFMAGNVVNGQFFYDPIAESSGVPATPEEQQLLASSRVTAIKSRSDTFKHRIFESVTYNLPSIAQAGEGAGFFNQIPEPDGIVRNAPLVLEYRGDFYPSLALKSLSRFLENAAIVVHADEFVITKVSLGAVEVPTNEAGAMPINYRGPAQTIKSISAVDILQGKVPEKSLEGNLVLLGVTAIGVFDSHGSPYGAEFPGLEIQANVIESIINNDAIQHNDLFQVGDFLVILFGTLVLAIVIPFTTRMPTRVLFFAALLSIMMYGNYLLFAHYNLWFNLTYPVIAWTSCFALLMLYQAFMVEARYSHVRSAFKHYLSADLVDQLTANPELLNFGGEEKELSILFSDIRNFTNLSETVTPSELSRFLQAYMDPMTDCVFQNNGTLDKYIGDAVMALFGAPVPFATHPVDACQSALDMMVALNKIVDTVPDLARLFPVRIGVGVHTGTVVVGNLGSSKHFNYTVIGDAVNLAARIEGLTKNYGVDVMISEVTYHRVKDHFVCRELDCVRVKGKQEPVILFELIGAEVDAEELAFLEQWQIALDGYRQANFVQAQSAFELSLSMKPGNYCAQLYIDRCAHFILEPVAEDWDGVFTYTSK